MKLKQASGFDVSLIWELLLEVDRFWSDAVNIASFEDFSTWWTEKVMYPLVIVDDDDEEFLLGLVYLDILYPGYYASISIVKRRGHITIKEAREIMSIVFEYYFGMFNLEKIIGIFRENNRACNMLYGLLGFTKDGTLRHHGKVDGEWLDYSMVSILKGELGNDRKGATSTLQ